MKYRTLVVSFCVILVGLFAFGLRDHLSDRAENPGTAEQEDVLDGRSNQVRLSRLSKSATPVNPGTSFTPTPPVKPAVAADTTPSTHTVPELPAEPPEEMIPVAIRVIEAGTSRPIAGVKVAVHSLYFGHYSRGIGRGPWKTERDGPAPFGTTDADGITTLAAPFNYVDKRAVLAIDVSTRHPEYADHVEENYPVASRMRDIALTPGNVLTVRAWMDDRGRKSWLEEFMPVLHDPRIQMGTLTQDFEPDFNRKSTGGTIARYTGLPAGIEYIVTVQHEFNAEVSARSQPRRFTFPEGGESQLDLEVELKPAFTLKGELSSNVPRPISNGVVQYNWMWGAEDDPEVQPKMDHITTVDIHPDGSFEIPGCTDGAAEIIAICDGYISSYRADGESERLNQIFEVSRDNAHELIVLQMQQAGGLQVQVFDPNEIPVQGARLFSAETVRWESNTHGVYGVIGEPSLTSPGFWRWTTISDRNGWARISTLREGRARFEIVSRDYEQKKSDERLRISEPVQIRGGEVTVTSVTLVHRGSQVIDDGK